MRTVDEDSENEHSEETCRIDVNDYQRNCEMENFSVDRTAEFVRRNCDDLAVTYKVVGRDERYPSEIEARPSEVDSNEFIRETNMNMYEADQGDVSRPSAPNRIELGLGLLGQVQVPSMFKQQPLNEPLNRDPSFNQTGGFIESKYQPEEVTFNDFKFSNVDTHRSIENGSGVLKQSQYEDTPVINRQLFERPAPEPTYPQVVEPRDIVRNTLPENIHFQQPESIVKGFQAENKENDNQPALQNDSSKPEIKRRVIVARNSTGKTETPHVSYVQSHFYKQMNMSSSRHEESQQNLTNRQQSANKNEDSDYEEPIYYGNGYR